jgi:preprotein translocase subunit SecD
MVTRRAFTAALSLACGAPAAIGQVLPEAISRIGPGSRVSFELRRATLSAGDIGAFKQFSRLGDWSFVVRDVHGREVLVANPPVLDQLDIGSTSLIQGDPNDSSPYQVMLHLTPDGAEKLALATRMWVNREMAFFLNGVCVTVAVVRVPLTLGRIAIPVPKRTKEQLEDIARGLALK